MGYGISNPWPRWVMKLYRFFHPPVPCARCGKLVDPSDLFLGRVWEYDGYEHYPVQAWCAWSASTEGRVDTMSTAELRKRVENWNRARRKTVDEPWGTSLATILQRDEPELFAKLVAENLDPTSYHAGAERYFAAWARVDELIAEELALVAAHEAKEKREQAALSNAPYEVPIDPKEHVPDLLPV